MFYLQWGGVYPCIHWRKSWELSLGTRKIAYVSFLSHFCSYFSTQQQSLAPPCLISKGAGGSEAESSKELRNRTKSLPRADGSSLLVVPLEQGIIRERDEVAVILA